MSNAFSAFCENVNYLFNSSYLRRLSMVSDNAMTGKKGVGGATAPR
jgi:hypothetical protein